MFYIQILTHIILSVKSCELIKNSLMLFISNNKRNYAVGKFIKKSPIYGTCLFFHTMIKYFHLKFYHFLFKITKIQNPIIFS